MNEFLILRDIGIVVVAAALAGLLARPARVPALVAYMIVGLVLGPATGLVEVTPEINLMSKTGIALLLFLVGLEMSIGTVRDVGRAAILAGVGQAAVVAVVSFGVATVLGFTRVEAAVFAIALTFSSTVVAINLLERRGDIRAVFGRLSLGVLLVQDLFAVIVLTLLAGVGGSGETESVPRSLLTAFAGMAVLGAAALLVASRVLPRFMRWLSAVPEALFIWSLAWCFLFMVAATSLGLSVEIGAFVAGVGLAQLPYNNELRRRVQPLVSFFIAVFFVSLGVRMRPGGALASPVLLMASILIVMVVKPGALAAILPRLGFGERTSFLTALTLAQISEFSMIVAALAAEAGLIGEEVVALIGAIGLVTMGVSAFAIERGSAIYDALSRTPLLRLLRAPAEPIEPPRRRMGHIIIVGMNTLGRILARELSARGQHVLVIDTDPSKLRGVDGETMTGNAEHPGVLRDADLETAQLLISTLQIEDANNLLAWRCREAKVPCSIHAFDPLVVSDLRALGVDYLMVSKHDGIRQVAAELRRVGVIE